mgnify:CR=1 FL=1
MILVKKINKIKKKEYLINIFKIITKDSKDFSENNNGIFIFFHNSNHISLVVILLFPSSSQKKLKLSPAPRAA